MSHQQRQQLITAAKEARQRAYAAYSGFQVGAALLATSGEIYSGCNVENASYGLTICAERVAATSAIAAGHRQFQQMAIVAEGAKPPCGACRQFLAEFNDDLPILLIDANDLDHVTQYRLGDLLPSAFRLRD